MGDCAEAGDGLVALASRKAQKRTAVMHVRCNLPRKLAELIDARKRLKEQSSLGWLIAARKNGGE